MSRLSRILHYGKGGIRLRCFCNNYLLQIFFAHICHIAFRFVIGLLIGVDLFVTELKDVLRLQDCCSTTKPAQRMSIAVVKALPSLRPELAHFPFSTDVLKTSAISLLVKSFSRLPSSKPNAAIRTVQVDATLISGLSGKSLPGSEIGSVLKDLFGLRKGLRRSTRLLLTR